MAARTLWVGIDASANELAICAIEGTGEIIKEMTVPASAESAHAALNSLKRKRLIVGIEPGDFAAPVARGLVQRGYDVRVLETRALSKFLAIRQNKTDRNDARGIADAARLGSETVAEVLLKSVEIQKLRSELVLRAQLMRQRLSLENVIRAVLRINGARLQSSQTSVRLEQSVKTEIARLRAGGNDLAQILGPTLSTAIMLRRALDKSTARLERAAKNNEICRRLMTIPGVGPLSALSFYTTIEDPHRFERSDDVAPYLGLVPKVRQSGTSSAYGRITKSGNKMTRTFLHSAAMAMLRSKVEDCVMRDWALAVAGRRGMPKARVALAKKLSIVMLAIWKSGEVWKPQGSKHRET